MKLLDEYLDKQSPENASIRFIGDVSMLDEKLVKKIELLEKEKGIPKEYMIEKIEAALLSAFKKEYGQTPIAYCINQKIEHVASMLITTDYPLTQIAQQFGFTDVKYLSKCFKRIKGQTPVPLHGRFR